MRQEFGDKCRSRIIATDMERNAMHNLLCANVKLNRERGSLEATPRWIREIDCGSYLFNAADEIPAIAERRRLEIIRNVSESSSIGRNVLDEDVPTHFIGPPNASALSREPRANAFSLWFCA
jgi:hypothetical protein